ncbi:MAG: C10 family peptidase, partial [Bacteroidales bacterium]|nr:C10 family peptidase [Bacteroidales bacterium]
MKNSTEKLIVTLKKLFGKYSKIFLFVLFLLMGHISLAQYVTPDSAKIVASKYLSNYLNQPKFKSSQKFDLKLIQTSQSDKKIEKSQFKSSSVPLYYVFSINAKDGFILIAADRKVQPIIGLSYIKNGDNNFSNIPPALKDWLLFLKEQIQEILFSRNSVKLKQNDGWNKILRNFKEGISDEFLLKTSWGQSYPFSNLIKEIVPVGCVTTGEAQIINYYRYPFKINSIHSYLESGNAPQIGTLNSKGYPINYLKFKNHYEGNKPGTSEDFDSIDYFTYDVAVSLETDFGNYSFIGGDGSSGYLKSPIHRDVVESLNEDYLYLLAEFWSIANHPLSGLTDWENKIKDEIIQNRPVLINSKDKNGGVQHAFICDGYSASMDKFHFNFGWYGNGDGWFSLDLITPIVTDEDGSKYYYDYSYNYPALNFTMLINIMPDLTRVQQDPYESDNDFSSATSLNNNQPQLHSISPKTDKDYYKLNLTSKANVIIETQGVNGNTQMWLYDGNHGYLAWDDDSGEGQNSKMTKTLEKGTYYIMVEVKGTSQCIPSYSIQYTATYTPRTLTVNSSNPNSGVEISISPNDNNGQGIGTTQFKRVYDDNTTVTLTAPQTASGNTFVKWQ